MIFTHGIVSAVDADAGKVRVTLPDRDDLPTDWLPICTPFGTKTNKSYVLPDIDEQVAVILDKHCNAGVVLGSIYSNEDTPDPDNSGLGVYALKLVQDGAAVFLAKIKRAAAGAFSLWSKSSVSVETASGNIEAKAGGRMKLTSTGPIGITVGDETLHKLLKDIGQFLLLHNHVVTGPKTTVLQPNDIKTATELALRIEKFTQD